MVVIIGGAYKLAQPVHLHAALPNLMVPALVKRLAGVV